MFDPFQLLANKLVNAVADEIFGESTNTKKMKEYMEKDRVKSIERFHQKLSEETGMSRQELAKRAQYEMQIEKYRK